MTNSLLLLSYLALWSLVLLIFVAVLLLYRRAGRQLLQSREGRINQGPRFDDLMPEVFVTDINGIEVTIGRANKSFQFVYFAGVDCPLCDQAKPFLGRLSTMHFERLETILVVHGDLSRAKGLVETLPANINIVADPRFKIGTKLGVSTTPYAIVASPEGKVLTKGLLHSEKNFNWVSGRIEQGHGKKTDFVPIEADA